MAISTELSKVNKQGELFDSRGLDFDALYDFSEIFGDAITYSDKDIIKFLKDEFSLIAKSQYGLFCSYIEYKGYWIALPSEYGVELWKKRGTETKSLKDNYFLPTIYVSPDDGENILICNRGKWIYEGKFIEKMADIFSKMRLAIKRSGEVEIYKKEREQKRLDTWAAKK